MHVDLGSTESIRDPSGYFRAARERGGAVQWGEAHRAWVVLSHAENEAALRDVETLSADRAEMFARAAARHSQEFGSSRSCVEGRRWTPTASGGDWRERLCEPSHTGPTSARD